MSFVVTGGHVLLQPLCGGAKQRKKRFIREMFDAFFSFISPLLNGIHYLSKPAIRKIRSMVLDGLKKGGLLEHDHTMASVRKALLHVASELLGKEVSGDISWLAKQISSLVHSAIEYVSYSDEKKRHDEKYYGLPFDEQFAKSEIRIKHFRGKNEGGATIKVVIAQPEHPFEKLLAAFLKQVEDYVVQSDVSIEVHIPSELRLGRLEKQNNFDKFFNYMRVRDFDSIWWLCTLDGDNGTAVGLRSSDALYGFMDVVSLHRKSEPKPAPNPVVILCTKAEKREVDPRKGHVKAAYDQLSIKRKRPLICNAKVLVCSKFPDPTGKSGLSVKTLLEESQKPNPMTCG